jgi:ribosome modulation factor
MTPVLTQDAKRVHRAFEDGRDQSAVVLSREALERIAQWLDAEAQGHKAGATHRSREVTPADAAAMAELMALQNELGLFE